MKHPKQPRNAGGLSVTRSATPGPAPKTNPQTKASQNAACGLVQHPKWLLCDVESISECGPGFDGDDGDRIVRPIARWPLQWNNGYPDFKSAAADANGGFTIPGLAPGVYRAAAVGPAAWAQKDM